MKKLLLVLCLLTSPAFGIEGGVTSVFYNGGAGNNKGYSIITGTRVGTGDKIISVMRAGAGSELFDSFGTDNLYNTTPIQYPFTTAPSLNPEVKRYLDKGRNRL